MNSPAYSSALRWRWSLSTLQPGLPNERNRFPNPQQEADNMLPMENLSNVWDSELLWDYDIKTEADEVI